MKMRMFIIIALLLSTSLFAVSYSNQVLNLDKTVYLKSFFEKLNAVNESLNMISPTKRYFQKTIQVGDESYDVIITQTYENSEWKNSERIVINSDLDIMSLMSTYSMLGSFDDEAAEMLFDSDFLFDALNQMFGVSQLTYLLMQEYGETGWIDVTRILGTVNNDGQLELITLEENVEGEWSEIGIINFEYTGSGMIDNFVLSAKLEDTDPVTELLMLENTYNANDQVITEEISLNSELLAKSSSEELAMWVTLFIQNTEYADFGKPVTKTIQMTLFGFGDPFDVSRTIYNYNSNQSLASRIMQNAEDGTIFGKALETTWTNSQKDTIVYNVSALVQSTTKYRWDDTWIDSLMSEYEYNNDNQMTLSLDKVYEDGNWVNEEKCITTYQNGLIKTELQQEFESGSPVDVYLDTYYWSGNVLTSIVNQEKINNEWMNTDRVLFTYNSPTAVEENNVVAREFSLQNYPNPFNPETTIEYQLSTASEITISIYDIQGRLIQTLVQDQLKSAGQHSVKWDGRDIHGNSVASGVYFYQLQGDNLNQTKRCLLMK